MILFKKQFLRSTIYAFFVNSNHVFGVNDNVYSSTSLYTYVCTKIGFNLF